MTNEDEAARPVGFPGGLIVAVGAFCLGLALAGRMATGQLTLLATICDLVAAACCILVAASLWTASRRASGDGQARLSALADRVVYLEERLHRFESGAGSPARLGQVREFGSRAGSPWGSEAFSRTALETEDIQVTPSLLPRHDALSSLREPRLDGRRSRNFGRSAAEPGSAGAPSGRADPAF